jgi:hypothetical protein
MLINANLFETATRPSEFGMKLLEGAQEQREESTIERCHHSFDKLENEKGSEEPRNSTRERRHLYAISGS